MRSELDRASRYGTRSTQRRIQQCLAEWCPCIGIVRIEFGRTPQDLDRADTVAGVAHTLSSCDQEFRCQLLVMGGVAPSLSGFPPRRLGDCDLRAATKGFDVVGIAGCGALEACKRLRVFAQMPPGFAQIMVNVRVARRPLQGPFK